MEILLVGMIILFIAEYNNSISTSKFIKDNEQYFKSIKEDDYDFLVQARFGSDVDLQKLFNIRIRNALITVILLIFMFLNALSFINVIAAFLVGFFVFKSQYTGLKAHYKKHLHEINLTLPYYLKSLEILIQHYTIPVAIAKSIDDAPEIFKNGLKDLIAKINAGDSSVDPYMEFAKVYPVRDSMRMMRLLYRLGLGAQDTKHEQLIMFSKSISALQNKAREQKYKERLNVMENKTMIMLGITGGGTLVLLLISMYMTFNI